MLRLYTIFFLLLLTYPVIAQRLVRESIEHAESGFLNFRENKGQWENNVLFRTRTGQSNVQFLKKGLSFGYWRTAEKSSLEAIEASDEIISKSILVWNLYFQGMNENASLVAKGASASKVSYLYGTDPSGHAINVSDFHELTYSAIYQGIDLKYYHAGDKLKYDFIIAPGGNANEIKMKCNGINGLNLDRQGGLEIKTAWGILREKAPYSYQVIDGITREVDVRFELLAENMFGFKVYGEYDNTKPLIIDPVIMEWSTFIGGDNPGGSGNIPSEGYINDIYLDSDGYVYGTGYYNNQNFPTTPGVYQPKHSLADFDVFVIKLAPDGKSLIWSTLIGGGVNAIFKPAHYGEGVVVNSAGEIIITGRTNSEYFPSTSNAYDNTHNGNQDAFVLKLNSTGSSLIYSSFFGGTRADAAYSIDIDVSDNVYITGDVSSTDFPVTATGYRRFLSGVTDAFMAKFDNNGKLIYSTFVGGSGSEKGNYIAVSPANEAYITGYTTSSDLPLSPGAPQSTYMRSNDAFVFKLSADGSKMGYSTYLGGSGRETGNAITVNAIGEAFVTGTTISSNFPVTGGAYDVNYAAGGDQRYIGDAFVTKINAQGTAFVFSTYLGNFGTDMGDDIRVTADGRVIVSGTTSETNNFPLVNCSQFKTSKGGNDLFLAILDKDGKQLDYSAIFSGSENDYYSSIEISETNCKLEIFLSTTSHSPDFPTTAGAYNSVKENGPEDQPVVMKLSPRITPDFTHVLSCNQATFTDVSSGGCVWKQGPWTPTSWKWDFGDGNTSTQKDPVHFYANPGSYQVKLVVGCPLDSITKSVTIKDVTNTVDLGPDLAKCSGAINVTLDAGNQPAGSTVSWSTGESAQAITVNTPGTYWVEVSSGGCSISDTVIIKSTKISLDILTEQKCGPGSATAKISGGDAPFTYRWDDLNNQTTATAINLAPGNYTVTVTDKNGCDASGTAEIGPVDSLEVKVSTYAEKCGSSDGAAIANVSGGSGNYAYEWSTGATTDSVSGLSNGTYTVIVTDDGGCSSTRSVTIAKEPNLNATVTIKYDDGCDRSGGTVGEATVIPTGGGGVYNYLWNDDKPQTTQTATGLAVGSYEVIVTDVGSGCSTTAKAVIEEKIQLEATVDIQPSCSSCADGVAEVSISGAGTPPYTLRWDDPAQQTTAKATGLASGTYTVTVTDNEGCRNSITVSVGITGISESDVTSIGLQIYPNPNNGEFIISLPSELSSGEAKVRVFEIRGRLIFSQEVYAATDGIQIVIPDKSPGLYFVEVTANKSVFSSRVLISKTD